MSDTVLGLAPTLSFSTEALPARERAAIWHETISRCLMRVEVTGPPDRAPFHELSMWALPGVSLVFGRGAACTASRTRSLVADGTDEILFNVNLAGHASAHWLGRETELLPGQGVIVPTADIGAMQFDEDFDYINLRLPRSELAPLVADLDALLVRPLPADTEAMHLLVHYAKWVRSTPIPVAPELRHLLAMHLRDLLAQAIGPAREAKHAARDRGVAAARLSALKDDVLGSLTHGPVTAASLAARHGISPVYVHKLFARDGTTVSAFVLEQRLLRAHRILSGRAHDHLGIATIAFGVGFGDLSHFNRQFHRRFGATPTDVRINRSRIEAAA